MPNDDLTTVIIPTRRKKVTLITLYTLGLVLIVSAITIPTTNYLARKVKTTTIPANTMADMNSTTTVTTTIMEISTSNIISTTIVRTEAISTTNIVPTTTTMETSTIPIVTTPSVTGSLCYIDDSTISLWIQDGITVAEGNEQDDELNQLMEPWGIYVDDNETVYIADYENDNGRIIEWKNGATTGHEIYARSGEENFPFALRKPSDIVFDRENDSFIVCDPDNKQVVRWPRQNNSIAEVIITGIACYGLAIDDKGYFYVPSYLEHEIRRWKIGDTAGKLVASGNGCGTDLDQTCYPQNVVIDHDYSLYIVDNTYDRILKWLKGAAAGIIIASSEQYANMPILQNRIYAIAIDRDSTLYILDYTNAQIIRWSTENTQPCIVIGENGVGQQANQLNSPKDLIIDQQGNIYVTDVKNHRIQKFNINSGIIPSHRK